ncbi:MAG: 4-hydroxy-tetrahydrodipicolinate synthase [Acidimicrobiales bacterium]
MTPRLGTLLTAMVTPFTPEGAADLDTAARLARFLVEEGSDGLVVAGSTGEGSSLSDAEKLDLFAAVAGAVTVPVLAGTSSADTARSVELTAKVAATGAAGILATTPAYARPNQSGIAGHLGAMADATDLPVMLYDIPSRTGRKIASATTVALVGAHPNVVAIKDASGDLAVAAHTKAVLGDRLDLYSGDDAVTLAFLAIGGVGLVSVAAHWAGPEFAAMIHGALKGDWEGARTFNERLAASYEFESSEAYPNPMPARAALRVRGLEVGECRAPHARGDATLAAAAAQVVGALLAQRG